MLGLRRGELLGLRWRDVNANAGTLTVHSTRVAVGAEVVEGPPKSSHGHRILPLDPTTLGMLAQLRHVQIQQLQGDWSLTGHVFTDHHGQPLQPGGVSKRFTALTRQLGLPAIRFHDARHTSATLGLAAGESLKEVSARLGHSSIVVTADTYLTPPDTLARAATTRLAGVLDGAWQPRQGEDAGRVNLREPIKRAGHSLAQALRRIAATVKRWAHALTGAVHAAASRHRDRIADDPGYTRTVATAVSGFRRSRCSPGRRWPRRWRSCSPESSRPTQHQHTIRCRGRPWCSTRSNTSHTR